MGGENSKKFSAQLPVVYSHLKKKILSPTPTQAHWAKVQSGQGRVQILVKIGKNVKIATFGQVIPTFFVSKSFFGAQRRHDNDKTKFADWFLLVEMVEMKTISCPNKS